MATTSGTQTREAHVISAIRDVLTVLESETGDRQYALEVIAGLVDSAGPFVHVEVRDVYGNQLVYPASDTARIFTGLTGKKTFTPGDLDHIRRLGYTITLATATSLPAGYGPAEVQAG